MNEQFLNEARQIEDRWRKLRNGQSVLRTLQQFSQANSVLLESQRLQNNYATRYRRFGSLVRQTSRFRLGTFIHPEPTEIDGKVNWLKEGF